MSDDDDDDTDDDDPIGVAYIADHPGRGLKADPATGMVAIRTFDDPDGETAWAVPEQGRRYVAYNDIAHWADV
jgi:hypothetical protein